VAGSVAQFEEGWSRIGRRGQWVDQLVSLIAPPANSIYARS